MAIGIILFIFIVISLIGFCLNAKGSDYIRNIKHFFIFVIIGSVACYSNIKGNEQISDVKKMNNNISDISFRFELVREKDLPLLFELLAISHVAQWWRESTDWNVFYEKFKGYLDADGMDGYFVYLKDTLVAHVAWQDVTTNALRSEQHPDPTYEIDFFVSDMDYTKNGYDQEIIRQFITKILMPMRPKKIIAVPELTDVDAIAAYEKIGMDKTDIVEMNDGTNIVKAQLMELNRLCSDHPSFKSL